MYIYDIYIHMDIYIYSCADVCIYICIHMGGPRLLWYKELIMGHPMFFTPDRATRDMLGAMRRGSGLQTAHDTD